MVHVRKINKFETKKNVTGKFIVYRQKNQAFNQTVAHTHTGCFTINKNGQTVLTQIYVRHKVTLHNCEDIWKFS